MFCPQCDCNSDCSSMVGGKTVCDKCGFVYWEKDG